MQILLLYKGAVQAHWLVKEMNIVEMLNIYNGSTSNIKIWVVNS